MTVRYRRREKQYIRSSMIAELYPLAIDPEEFEEDVLYDPDEDFDYSWDDEPLEPPWIDQNYYDDHLNSSYINGRHLDWPDPEDYIFWEENFINTINKPSHSEYGGQSYPYAHVMAAKELQESTEMIMKDIFSRFGIPPHLMEPSNSTSHVHHRNPYYGK